MPPFGRAIAARRYPLVVLACAAQSGKTETFLDVIGHRLDQRPAPIIYVGPAKQFLQEQFEPRVMALLDEAPLLRDKVARGKRMTKTRKVIAGVPVRLAHAGSSTALKSDPAALALVDEYDEMLANVKGQGDPLGLVLARGDTYADFVAAVVSTPSLGSVDVELDAASGLEFWKPSDPSDVESPIWRLFQQGTRHHWCWPCPHCGEYFVLRGRQLRWPKGSSPAQARREAYVECPRCGGVIEESHKAKLNERGAYVAPGETIDKAGVITGEPADVSILSKWVSGLASPFRTFGQRAERFLQAMRSKKSDERQTAINAGFGECFAPVTGEAPKWRAIRDGCRAQYMLGEVPESVEVLTLTCDVQKDRLIYVIRGWAALATSWLIAREEIRAAVDTTEIAVWDELAQIVSAEYGGLTIRLALIDSGFRPGKPWQLPVNRIYQFCARFTGRRVLPTKGHAQQRAPVRVAKPEITKRGKIARYGLELVHLDTDHWKRWVFERVAWPQEQPGAWRLPADIDDDYCMQIASERRLVTASGTPIWKQTSQQNHYLDCEAMQGAASFLLGMHRRRLTSQTSPPKPPGTTATPGAQPTWFPPVKDWF